MIPCQHGLRYLCPGSFLTMRAVPDLAAIVSRNIRAERHRHGWRQRDLAERVGWSVGMISDTESGQRRIGVEDLPVLCRALDIPLAQLLHGADAADLRALGL
jgi:transcriptional regulator with XRE-family HTH domain